MVHRKLIALTVIILFSLIPIFSGCKGRYHDVSSIMNQIIDAEEILIEKLAQADKTNKAEDASFALDNYSAQIKAMIPRMKAALSKYPQLSEDTPAELKPLRRKAGEIALKLSKCFLQADKKFSQNPHFEQARNRYYTILTSSMLE